MFCFQVTMFFLSDNVRMFRITHYATLDHKSNFTSDG